MYYFDKDKIKIYKISENPDNFYNNEISILTAF